VAQLSERTKDVLVSALNKRRRDDTIEEAVGREVRKVGLTYHDYMTIMDTVRDRARRDKVDPWDAAKRLSDEQ